MALALENSKFKILAIIILLLILSCQYLIVILKI